MGLQQTTWAHASRFWGHLTSPSIGPQHSRLVEGINRLVDGIFRLINGIIAGINQLLHDTNRLINRI